MNQTDQINETNEMDQTNQTDEMCQMWDLTPIMLKRLEAEGSKPKAKIQGEYVMMPRANADFQIRSSCNICTYQEVPCMKR